MLWFAFKCVQQALDDGFGLGVRGTRELQCLQPLKPLEMQIPIMSKNYSFLGLVCGLARRGAKHTRCADSDIGKTLVAWVTAHKGLIEGFMIWQSE